MLTTLEIQFVAAQNFYFILIDSDILRDKVPEVAMMKSATGPVLPEYAISDQLPCLISRA